MKKKTLLTICLTILLGIGAPTFSVAEEIGNGSSILDESSHVTSSEEKQRAATSENTVEPQKGSTIQQSITVQSSEPTQATEESSQSTTAIVNGEVVEFESPQKAGQEEAAITEAPKEELIQQRAYTSRASSIALYRLYNPNSGEHFYTKTVAERDNLRRVGWRYEGIGWQSLTSGGAVYRLYNKNSGEHFYTMNTGERDNLKRLGWRYEGIGWYSAASNQKPVYRLYNPNDRGAGAHHYTLFGSERDHLKKVGWRYEGISWYAVGDGQQIYEDYRLLGVRNYNQYALGAPSGCEGAALLQALQYKGKLSTWSLRSFLNTIPKSTNGNPNNGFVGSPFVENSWTYSAIYPSPLTSWGKKYGNVQNISGSSMTTLMNEVKNGNPVVAWVTINFQPLRWGNWSFGIAANNNHAVTLDGYNKTSNQVHVSDPISGSYWLNRTTFEQIYNARKYAVVVK